MPNFCTLRGYSAGLHGHRRRSSSQSFRRTSSNCKPAVDTSVGLYALVRGAAPERFIGSTVDQPEEPCVTFTLDPPAKSFARDLYVNSWLQRMLRVKRAVVVSLTDLSPFCDTWLPNASRTGAVPWNFAAMGLGPRACCDILQHGSGFLNESFGVLTRLLCRMLVFLIESKDNFDTLRVTDFSCLGPRFDLPFGCPYIGGGRQCATKA
jgi:hypothetical protein